jgi:penicillin amidase
VEDPHGHNPPVPSPFYAVHLVSPDWEVFGLSAPGMPFFQHAYNRHVAYGSTTAGSDIQDLYIEKVNPDNPDEYLYRGRWKKFNRRYETIRVKDVSGAGGFREEKIHILSTLHGPVIHDKREDRERKVLSLKWFAFDERIIRSMREMSEARTVEEFFRAAEGYVSGAENFLVADSSGSIGYICAGYYPLRPSGTVNWFPLPGWTGEHEWQGGITGRDLPRIINPGKGFLASANNRIASKKTEQKLEGMVASHHRFSRIVQLLSKRNKVSCQYSKKMLGDTRSLFAEEMVSLYLRELEGVDTSAVNQIRGYLLDWDFSMSRDSVAATVFHHLTYELMRETFIDELGQNNTQKYLKKWYRALGRWVHILKDSEDWIDDTRTPDRETRKDLLLRACDSTIGNLTKDFGENGKHWTWGKVHTLSYRHRPMDEGGWLLRKVFSLGSFSVGGDMDTINRASYSIAGQKSSDKFLDVNNSSSFRLIVDFARPDEVLFVQSTGQSEHLISPHRSDHLKTMLEGDLFTINLDIGFVKKRTEGVRILMPAGE